ncbi:PREDICTED: vitellogenin-1-like [Rhagoletis zephyria]|uniref:vitellogenin-1-like n=1 Tax=Rhagoletis zephyria TaxID=28612 RepID=UPI00081138BC|nr:PREDICTED: vitellogenin-1-like [Rhagoletis zephyria]
MRVCPLLVSITAISACFAAEIPLDGAHAIDVSLPDLLQSAGDIATGLVDAFGNQLTPSYFFNFVGNLVLGFPIQFASLITSTICAAVLTEDGINPDPADVPSTDDISIQLRTACDIKTYRLKDLATIVDDPDFDASKRVVIAASGWLTNANKSDDVLEGLGKAYRCRGDTNFLGIDVGRYIETLYTWSSLNTKNIGEQVANALVDLTKVVPLENFHLMGHSLGAQIVGETARKFKRLTGKQIPRVTGFDPAGPCFNYGQKLITLSTGDADYVDIIHTDPGIAAQPRATGDSDFFVGGRFPIQNGCLEPVCSHQRSWQYYVESVYPGNEYNFPSKRCDSLLHLEQGRCVGKDYPMGYAVPKNLKGLFVLKVNPSEPYGTNSSSSYTSPSSECGSCESIGFSN